MISDEVNALLELQYLAIQELNESGKFPTRDEVVDRVEEMINEQDKVVYIQ